MTIRPGSARAFAMRSGRPGDWFVSGWDFKRSPSTTGPFGMMERTWSPYWRIQVWKYREVLIVGRMYTARQAAEATGVPEGTFLAWERRYGVPPSTRDARTGETLYSERSVGIIKWLLQQRGGGLTISQAILLVRASGRSPGSPEAEDGDP